MIVLMSLMWIKWWNMLKDCSKRMAHLQGTNGVFIYCFLNQSLCEKLYILSECIFFPLIGEIDTRFSFCAVATLALLV